MTQFRNNVINKYGKSGIAWIENLPKIIEEIAAKWRLINLKPMENLSCHYVLSGLKDDKPIILKLFLDIRILDQEINALKAFKNDEIVEILGLDDGALLLERAIPGTSLKSYFPHRDNDAIKIASNLIKKLHNVLIPKEHNFPHIKDWLKILDQDLDIPTDYLEKTRKIRDMLLASSQEEVLLHGDFHHYHILQNGQKWLVIDPRGIIGERAYEVTNFIRNPIVDLSNQSNPHDIINNRIEKFSTELSLDRKRVKDWCFVHSVLSVAWALEDKADANALFKLMEIFSNLN